MEFRRPAPGLLTLESGQHYADYQVLSGNFGYTDSEAEALIDSVLQSASGWERAGVIARNVGAGAPVTFRFVHGPFLCGGVMANGCTTGGTVTLSYERAEEGFLQNITNHEAGHAFFSGTHEGVPGIMTGDSPDGLPTSSDIADVREWLSLAPEDPPTPPTNEGVGGIYWFPADLDTYMSVWPVSQGQQARLTTTVLGGVAGTALKGVWGNSRDDLIEGRIHPFTPALSSANEGFYESDWLPATSFGELCIGILVRRSSAEVDLNDLIVGLAEVQIRSTA